MKKQPNKHSPMKGTFIMNTVRLAVAYACNICTICFGSSDAKSGVSYEESAKKWNSFGIARCKEFCSAAAEIARPTAPPRLRMKLRFEMTTARWAFVQCACSATSTGWKTAPTPSPWTKSMTTIAQMGMSRLNMHVKPTPKVQRKNPSQITPP